MNRSRSFFLVLICTVFLITPAILADYQDMKGTWVSIEGTRYILNNTIQTSPIGENTWVIMDQNDNTVLGYKTYTNPGGKPANETFVGIFDPNGKILNFIDQPGAFTIGTLIDQDTLAVAFMDPGTNSDESSDSFAISMTLHRQVPTAQ